MQSFVLIHHIVNNYYQSSTRYTTRAKSSIRTALCNCKEYVIEGVVDICKQNFLFYLLLVKKLGNMSLLVCRAVFNRHTYFR